MRTQRIIILALLIIAGVVLTNIPSQSFKILSGTITGPASCTTLSPALANYFTLGNSGVRAFFTDSSTGDIYFSRLVNPGSGLPSVIKVTNIGCGGWFGIQSIVYWDDPTLITTYPNSFAEDINQPTHFFESWPGGGQIDIVRTAKDGSSRVVILSYLTTINGYENVAFDALSDRVVWHSSLWALLGRCDRNGLNVQVWGLGYRPGAHTYFQDGRLAVADFLNSQLKLYNIGWGGAVSQFVVLPGAFSAGGAYTWMTVDNVRNQVHIFRESALHGIWDIGTNTFNFRAWTTFPGDPRYQGAYNEDWVYTKLNGNRMCRYNWTTGIEQSWDGSQFLY